MIEYIKFATLPVRNQDRALKFYRDRLGFEVVTDRPYMGELRWIELAIPGARTRIWFAERADDAPAQQPTLILMTRDVPGTHAALAAKGVEFTQEPTKAQWSPGTLFALLRDSEGNLIMLGQHDE